MAANFIRYGKVITWQAVFQINRRIFSPWKKQLGPERIYPCGPSVFIGCVPWRENYSAEEEE
jgi:hypothetical protein